MGDEASEHAAIEAEELVQDLIEVVCRHCPSVYLEQIKLNWEQPGCRLWKQWNACGCRKVQQTLAHVHAVDGRWFPTVDDGAARLAYGTTTP